MAAGINNNPFLDSYNEDFESISNELSSFDDKYAEDNSKRHKSVPQKNKPGDRVDENKYNNISSDNPINKGSDELKAENSYTNAIAETIVEKKQVNKNFEDSIPESKVVEKSDVKGSVIEDGSNGIVKSSISDNMNGNNVVASITDAGSRSVADTVAADEENINDTTFDFIVEQYTDIKNEETDNDAECVVLNPFENSNIVDELLCEEEQLPLGNVQWSTSSLQKRKNVSANSIKERRNNSRLCRNSTGSRPLSNGMGYFSENEKFAGDANNESKGCENSGGGGRDNANDTSMSDSVDKIQDTIIKKGTAKCNGIKYNYEERNYTKCKKRVASSFRKINATGKNMLTNVSGIYQSDARDALNYGRISLSASKTLALTITVPVMWSVYKSYVEREFGTTNSKKALRKVNTILKKYNINPLTESGFDLTRQAKRMLKILNKKAKMEGKTVPKEVIDILKSAQKLGDCTEYDPKRFKGKLGLVNLTKNFGGVYIRSLSQCEAGSGLGITVSFMAKATSVIKRSWRLVQEAASVAKKVARKAVLSGIRAANKAFYTSHKKARFLERCIDKGLVAKTAENKRIILKDKKRVQRRRKIQKTRRRAHNKLSGIKGRFTAGYGKVIEKYTIRGRWRVFKKKLMKKKLIKKLSKYKEKLIVRIMAKTLRSVGTLFKVLSTVVGALFLIIVVTVIILVILLLTKDFNVAGSKTTGVIVKTLTEEYNNDIGFIINEYTRNEGEQLKIQFYDNKNESEYVRMMNELGAGYDETDDGLRYPVSNIAEIVSVIYRLYEDEYENEDYEEEIKEKAVALWRGSHSFSHTEEEVEGEDGACIVHTVTYTTDYFEHLFNDDFMDSRSIVNEIPVSSYESNIFIHPDVREEIQSAAAGGGRRMRRYLPFLEAFLAYETQGGGSSLENVFNKIYDRNKGMVSESEFGAVTDASVTATTSEPELDNNTAPALPAHQSPSGPQAGPAPHDPDTDYTTGDSGVPKPGSEQQRAKWIVSLFTHYFEFIEPENDKDILSMKKIISLMYLGEDAKDKVKRAKNVTELRNTVKKFIQDNSFSVDDDIKNGEFLDDEMGVFKYLRLKNQIKDKDTRRVIESLEKINTYSDVAKALIYKGAELIGYTTYSQPKRQPDAEKPLFLDCSGFTRWVFVKSGVCKKLDAGYYTGSFLQSEHFQDISFNDLQPGDIGLKNDSLSGGQSNHVGIYIGRDKDGNMMWMHCTSGNWYNKVAGKESGPMINQYPNFRIFKRIKPGALGDAFKNDIR